MYALCTDIYGYTDTINIGRGSKIQNNGNGILYTQKSRMIRTTFLSVYARDFVESVVRLQKINKKQTKHI